MQRMLCKEIITNKHFKCGVQMLVNTRVTARLSHIEFETADKEHMPSNGSLLKPSKRLSKYVPLITSKIFREYCR